MDEVSPTQQPQLTFSAIEARLKALPKFQSKATRTPLLIRWAAALVSGGITLTLVASSLALTRIPLSWLGKVATLGWWAALAGFVPLMFYSCYNVITDMRRWTRDQAERTDHQLEHFLGVVGWLRGHPIAHLRTLLDHARYSHARRASRIALVAGSMDKLGILPALIALFLTLRSGGDPLAMSPWTALVGLLLLFLWIVCWTATYARGEFQTYEYLLDMALKPSEPHSNAV